MEIKNFSDEGKASIMALVFLVFFGAACLDRNPKHLAINWVIVLAILVIDIIVVIYDSKNEKLKDKNASVKEKFVSCSSDYLNEMISKSPARDLAPEDEDVLKNISELIDEESCIWTVAAKTRIWCDDTLDPEGFSYGFSDGWEHKYSKDHLSAENTQELVMLIIERLRADTEQREILYGVNYPVDAFNQLVGLLYSQIFSSDRVIQDTVTNICRELSLDPDQYTIKKRYYKTAYLPIPGVICLSMDEATKFVEDHGSSSKYKIVKQELDDGCALKTLLKTVKRSEK